MQELKKKHRKKPKKELERGAQKEQKNLTDITEEQLKVNIGIVRLGNMIKVIQIVMKVLLCMLAVLFSFLAILLHEAANWMLATWTNLSMEELVAQLKTPIQGTSHEVLWDFVETCIPAAVMAVFFVVLVIVMVRKTKITKWVVQIGAVAGSMALIVSSGQMVWNELDVGEYLENQDTISMFLQENYMDPALVPVTFPEQKRNLVYIFMESMESTYASTDVGGAFAENDIPEMTQLAMENVNFSTGDMLGGLIPSDGATWTMGAMVAQTSGLPLKVKLRAENIQEDVQVLPGATVLGDMLAVQGYKQVVMFGSEGEFAGRKQYFEGHGNYEVKDLLYAQQNGLIPPDYRVWWGYEDHKLYDFARREVTNLANSGQPFNFTMLTVDTHFEDGYVCDLCQDEHPGNQYANVMSCASRQVVDFVNWLKAQPFYENTTIVIVGDHLTIDTHFPKYVPES